MVNIPHPRVAFGDLPDQFKTDADEVRLPRKTLVGLLDLYISSWDFDEDWYLTTYPDIAAAVSSARFASGQRCGALRKLRIRRRQTAVQPWRRREVVRPPLHARSQTK